MSEYMRCGSCGKIVLNHPEPYLGEPEAVAAAPWRAVKAQRETLIQCSTCRSTGEAMNQAFQAEAERQRAAGVTGPITIAYSGRETYGDHRNEWEDMATGDTGGPGFAARITR